ncbi:AAEL009263-PA [Aedes aegypti]|uniref:BZIP1 n=2 Tax=Aedes aegypti TaxID=7159 RepID=Q16WD3_AEDAE|nr:uncharacterized protein LOC5571736 [Aedes aegypti]XP_021700730.1 uncharacterized protein LOC5571736 [Aedes aegypti]AFF19514.1 bZIP1 [Aedes aegypti]EAT38885.1 AAEL009263-PA [Aedes aegypti]
MAPHNSLHPDTHNDPSSTESDSNSNQSKKIKYDDSYQNMMFRAGFTNMHNEYIYNKNRTHALMMRNDRYSMTSTTSSIISSLDGNRSTPSPDFAMSMGQVSSPLFNGFMQSPGEPSQSIYDQSRVRSPATFNNPQEHNYAVDSPHALHTPEPIIRPARARVTSDSGNSSIPEVDDINPLCMNDFFRDAVNPELAEKLNSALTTIEAKSAQHKERYLEMRMCELPTDLEYNPNKSRLRKVYESPMEAAERERNNLASRKSRFKKKIAQQITNMHLEFDRSESADLYAMQNWMGQVIFELESNCLDRGITPECLADMRQQCGFLRNQNDKVYRARPSF